MIVRSDIVRVRTMREEKERIRRFIKVFEQRYGRKPKLEDAEGDFKLQVARDMQMSVGERVIIFGWRQSTRTKTPESAEQTIGDFRISGVVHCVTLVRCLGDKEEYKFVERGAGALLCRCFQPTNITWLKNYVLLTKSGSQSLINEVIAEMDFGAS